jgi:hypothetical protein
VSRTYTPEDPRRKQERLRREARRLREAGVQPQPYIPSDVAEVVHTALRRTPRRT